MSDVCTSTGDDKTCVRAFVPKPKPAISRKEIQTEIAAGQKKSPLDPSLDRIWPLVQNTDTFLPPPSSISNLLISSFCSSWGWRRPPSCLLTGARIARSYTMETEVRALNAFNLSVSVVMHVCVHPGLLSPSSSSTRRIGLLESLPGMMAGFARRITRGINTMMHYGSRYEYVRRPTTLLFTPARDGEESKSHLCCCCRCCRWLCSISCCCVCVRSSESHITLPSLPSSSPSTGW